jgi:glycosyltransferase involved in cell wall biosynthesis
VTAPSAAIGPDDSTFPASVSVVVCTRGRPGLLHRCLSAITAATAGAGQVPVEVIVVDNGPDELTREVTGAFGSVRYVAEPVTGLDVARNRGLQAATGDVVAFTDDDVVVDPGWIAELISAWRSRPGSLVVTGRVLPLAQDTKAQVLFEECGGFTPGDPGHRESVPAERAWAEAAGFGAGCNMSVRRQDLLDLGGFDENLDTGPPLPGGGDLELFHRVIQLPGGISYAPRAIVFHEHRRTMKELRRQYRSWGKTWAVCVLGPSPSRHLPGRPEARQMLAWLRWQFNVARRSGWRRRILVGEELLGAAVGLVDDYERSRSRMASRRATRGEALTRP